MLRTITMLVLAAFLSGCTTVYVPIPVPINGNGLALPAAAPTEAATEVPAATEEPTAEPTEPAADVPADVALYKERYATFESTYNALSAHMESMDFTDAAWRDETARLALEWHDAIDVLQATTCPEGDMWNKACMMLKTAMMSFGYAAGNTERAARENDPTALSTVRSDMIKGTTLLTDAMNLLKGQ